MRVFEFLESGVYTPDEFLAQKDTISRQIAQKETLIHDQRVTEFNMDEALEYCFNFVRQTAKTWLELEAKPEKRLRFQNLIFDENIFFSGEKFETTKLTPIYSVYQQYLEDPSCLVTLSGFEPEFQP